MVGSRGMAWVVLAFFSMGASEAPAQGVFGNFFGGEPESVPAVPFSEWRSPIFEPGDWYPSAPSRGRGTGSGSPERRGRVPGGVRDVGLAPDFSGAEVEERVRAGVRLRVRSAPSQRSVDHFWIRAEVDGIEGVEIEAVEFAPLRNTMYWESVRRRRLAEELSPALRRAPGPFVLERPVHTREFVEARVRFRPAPGLLGDRGVHQTKVGVWCRDPVYPRGDGLEFEARLESVNGRAPEEARDGRGRTVEALADLPMIAHHRLAYEVRPAASDPRWERVLDVRYRPGHGDLFEPLDARGTGSGRETWVRQDGRGARASYSVSCPSRDRDCWRRERRLVRVLVAWEDAPPDVHEVTLDPGSQGPSAAGP